MTLFNAAFVESGEFTKQYGSNQYVRAYLKAQTRAAKDEAAAAVASHIPYFDAIPHICHFTFNTNFQREQQVASIVTGVASIYKEAYATIRSGDIAGGMAKLSSAGVSNDVACALIDEYVSGGLIGDTPVIGQLAQGACAGFVGKVFGAAKAVGSEVMSAIDDVGDFLSGQTKNIPGQQYYELYWRPRIPEGVVAARTPAGVQPLADSICGPCVEYFDSHTMSEDSANETCNFQRDKQFTPDVFARLTIADTTVPQWVNGIAKSSSQQCADDICAGEVETLRQSALGIGRDLAQNRIDLGWDDIRSSLAFLPTSANDAVRRSKDRQRSLDKTTTANAAAGYAKLAIAVFTPHCLDVPCTAEIKSIAAAESAALNEYQNTHPDASALNVVREILPVFEKKFDSAIQASKVRRILLDPHATAAVKLPLLGCGAFLGRSGEWLCHDDSGFAACKSYLAGSAAVRCLDARTGAIAAEPWRAARDLEKLGGCTFVRSGLAYRLVCKTAEGRKLCTDYKRGGLKLNCDGGFAGKPARRQ